MSKTRGSDSLQNSLLRRDVAEVGIRRLGLRTVTVAHAPDVDCGDADT